MRTKSKQTKGGADVAELPRRTNPMDLELLPSPSFEGGDSVL